MWFDSGLTEHLVETAKRDVNDGYAVAADRMVGQDIAGVRVQPAFEEQEDAPTMSEGMAEGDGPGDVRLDHRAVISQHSAIDGTSNVRAIQRELQCIELAVQDTREGEEEDADGDRGGKPAAGTVHGEQGPPRAAAAHIVQVPRAVLLCGE